MLPTWKQTGGKMQFIEPRPRPPTSISSPVDFVACEWAQAIEFSFASWSKYRPQHFTSDCFKWDATFVCDNQGVCCYNSVVVPCTSSTHADWLTKNYGKFCSLTMESDLYWIPPSEGHQPAGNLFTPNLWVWRPKVKVVSSSLAQLWKASSCQPSVRLW